MMISIVGEAFLPRQSRQECLSHTTPAFYSRVSMAKTHLRPTATSIALLIPTFWISLYLAWNSLSAVNFVYPWLYNQMDLGATIEKFGPQNRYKESFGHTDRAEHIRLFSQIVHAINNNGEGLETIRYHDPQGRPIDTLLRTPEVVHLQDVANLLAVLRIVSYIAIAGWVVLVALIIHYRIPIPPVRRLLLITAATCATAAGAVIALGATNVFYALHTWIFPPDHQWFFYYQESLMTTLMKAPDIFGYIAVLLVIAAIAYFTVMLWAIRRVTAVSKNR